MAPDFVLNIPFKADDPIDYEHIVLSLNMFCLNIYMKITDISEVCGLVYSGYLGIAKNTGLTDAYFIQCWPAAVSVLVLGNSRC